MVVVGPSGKKLRTHVVETNASVLVELRKTIPRPRHLCFEEGTQSAWLYEVLAPHADETVVTLKQERRGNKDDERDAFSLADSLRTNSIKVRVYKDVGRYGPLRELCRVHTMQVADSVRVQNRILSLYRSRGIATSDSLYNPEQRADWIGLLPNRRRASIAMLDAAKQALGHRAPNRRMAPTLLWRATLLQSRMGCRAESDFQSRAATVHAG